MRVYKYFFLILLGITSTNFSQKLATDIIKLLDDIEKMNANLLLNVGPEGDGTFLEEDILILVEAEKIISNNFK